MKIPRLHFAHLPTPIEPLPRLSEVLGGPRLLVKRDDQTGLAFGGNKTRKLEFLVADALEQGARTLVTTGALQSNHCRQTAAAAARFGLDCTLVLVGRQPAQSTANLMLDGLLGADLVWAGAKDQRDALLAETFSRLEESGARPYLVPYGGSNPIGALGYVFAMEELSMQNTPADWIVFASSSGGTQAGMALGARMFGPHNKLLGISIEDPQPVLQERAARLAGETAARLGRAERFAPDEMLVNGEFLGDGYGVFGAPEREALRMFARTEGLLLDPVYTGRAAAGLIALVRNGFFRKDETVLFWHTGGGPALFAERYAADLT